MNVVHVTINVPTSLFWIINYKNNFAYPFNGMFVHYYWIVHFMIEVRLTVR